MDNTYITYYGEDGALTEDNLHYYDMLDTIEKDIKKFLNYIVCDYKDNEELILECKYLLKNIHNVRPYDDSYENYIELTDKFLTIDYPMFDNWNGKFYYRSNVVIIRRNYKEFYFLYPERTSLTLKIKKYKLENNKVEEYIYREIPEFYGRNDDMIEESIKKLELTFNKICD